MRLAEYLDTKKLEHHVLNGLVVARRHGTLPLTVYSYGRRAVYGNIWDDVTRKTRGLIVADDGEIVARPYEKFFSYEFPGISETYPRSVDNIDKEFGPPTITEKINGCLGTFWKYGNDWGIATKGSFNSPHAQWATKWMQNHVEQYGTLVFPEGYTPVFEIICQTVQTHVIKYEKDECVLLNFVNIETGEELGLNETIAYGQQNKLRTPRYLDTTIWDVLGQDANNFEGYVATYNRPGHTPFKLKIKFPTFLENRKVFYEEQKRAKELEANRESGTLADVIRDSVKEIVKESLTKCTTREEFARYFTKTENAFYAPACFAYLNYEDSERREAAIKRLVEKWRNMTISNEEREARKQARLGKNYIYPWIGVDLDGTLAVYDTFVSETHIGEPIPAMVERVFKWLSEGKVVKILTARASEPDPAKRAAALDAIARWSLDVFGTSLPVTCIKDYGLVELWDDRAIQIIKNTGKRADGGE